MTTTAYSGRPTMHKGILMRSRLEAATAAAFDRGGVAWEYEPCAFQGKAGHQYLPDFRIDVPFRHDLLNIDPEGTRRSIYVEVKPSMEKVTGKYVGATLSAIRSSEPDAFVVIAVPTESATVLCLPGPVLLEAHWCWCSSCDRIHLTLGPSWSFSCCGEYLLRRSLVDAEYWKAAV